MVLKGNQQLKGGRITGKKGGLNSPSPTSDRPAPPQAQSPANPASGPSPTSAQSPANPASGPQQSES